MCLSLPACQDLYLASGMPAPAATPPPDSTGPELSTAPGPSQTPVLGFPVQSVVPGLHRRQRTGERDRGGQAWSSVLSCLRTSVSFLEHEWGAGLPSKIL